MASSILGIIMLFMCTAAIDLIVLKASSMFIPVHSFALLSWIKWTFKIWKSHSHIFSMKVIRTVNNSIVMSQMSSKYLLHWIFVSNPMHNDAQVYEHVSLLTSSIFKACLQSGCLARLIQTGTVDFEKWIGLVWHTLDMGYLFTACENKWGCRLAICRGKWGFVKKVTRDISI